MPSFTAVRSRPLRPFRLHLTRLLHAPRVQAGDGGEVEGRATVELRGVVCGVCANRTEAALSSVRGVESATVDLDAARAVLRLSPGAKVEAAQLQRALERVVVAMPARRLIERVADRLRSLSR